MTDDGKAGGESLGTIVAGSLSKGLELKLDPAVETERLRAGMFAIAGGERYDFFSLLTDLELAAATPDAAHAPPTARGSFAHEVLAGDTLFTRANLRPHLMVDRQADKPDEALLPVKTIPPHFAAVRRATPEDVERVFGSEAGSRGHFHIGAPLEMDEIPLCLNLDAFAERSNGIFGKSGTGKTFLTRMVLCGLVQKHAAVNLIFDMHGEYGWRGTDETREGGTTRSLRELFGARVQVFGLGSRESGRHDWAIRIPYSFLEPEDLLGLRQALQLSPTAAEAVYAVLKGREREWFEALPTLDANAVDGAHVASVQSLQRKVQRLQRECEGFLRPDVEFSRAEPDAIERIIHNLECGTHTVIDFGRYGSLLHYLLVANVITRRIDDEWRKKTDAYLHAPEQGKRPPRVVITIEEAHKFLEPGIAEQTIFGRIARELRKYNVTLLVVDQRPSRIEREVLSQLGTKICCLLDDEADVDAVLAGTSASGGLRNVLASLDTRQQALIFGHALPMPVVVKTRSYDEGFWRSVGYRTEEERHAAAAALVNRDFPDDD